MRFIFLFLLSFFASTLFAQATNYATRVNPFIGTGGHGHTYPGVTTPFGMMQLSPDTRLDGWDGCGGYHYSDSIIYGFSHTHLSGTGVSDYGDLLIMPFTGKTAWESGYYSQNTNGYGSYFSHKTEKAQAGYYAVFLADDNIEVELTSSPRCGYHHYTYPKWDTKKIIIDLTHRDQLLATELILINDSTLLGKRISKAWAKEQHFYFFIQFSEAATKRQLKKDKNGNPTKLVLEFGHVNPVLKLKVGMSAVDIDGAKRNLKKEMPHWEFNKYRQENQTLWNNELSKVKIQTQNKEKEVIFYTALYHSFLNPNLFSDADGRYRGLDGNIHADQKSNQYTVFSLWDTFRATHPLFTLIQKEKTIDFITTLLRHYEQGGILPMWELAANYTGCMIGYHSIPVIVDALMKGIDDFDKELILKAMLNSAEQDHLGLKAFKNKGYISSEDESESVSKTLEYAYDDWCIAIFADSLGYDSIASVYYQRAQAYKNVFNATTKFMAPRYNGGWKNNFAPNKVTFDYTEANAWQYSLFVPQDINGLVDLLGGKDSLAHWLDQLFLASTETTGRKQVDITGLIGQYAHGNEPSHHLAYLYNFTNASWKTQKYIHQIGTTLYSNAPDGLSGNEDCGQLSSWYVLSSLGLYPCTPGLPLYLTGTPFFEAATLHLENGNTFTIKATNLSDTTIYVQSITLNNEKLNRNYITHSEIMSGGELIFKMGEKPSQHNWKSPSISIEKSEILPSPCFVNSSKTFAKKKYVEIDPNTNQNVKLHYTKNGKWPTAKSKIYKKPIKLKKSTTLKVISIGDTLKSLPVESSYDLTTKNWVIKLNTPYSAQYAAGGDRALIDHVNGGMDFRTGGWQGYLGADVDIELDFKKKKKIKTVAINFIQDINSWIWMPLEVRFLISEDGKNWFNINTTKNTIPYDQYGAIIHKIEFSKRIKTRYLKIVAINRGVCPTWHLGNGNKTWIFADEISIQ